MKKTWFMIVILFMIVYGCKCTRQEPDSDYAKESAFTQAEYEAAAKKAYDNDPRGYLKLYEIARNDNNIYVTDWQEIAHEEVFRVLYFNTDLWIKTYSKTDVKKFKEFIGPGIEIPDPPEGVSREQFTETILNNLEKVKGDDKAMELVDYILGLYKRKRK